MDTRGQIGIFALYVCMGFCCGFIYEFFAFIRLILGAQNGRRKFVGGVLDVGFCVCAFISTIVCAYALKLPTSRFYAWLGFILGGIIYLKSLRRMVAFLENLCYNKCKSLMKKAKRRKNTLEKVEEEV